jgi:hypothetical protein
VLHVVAAYLRILPAHAVWSILSTLFHAAVHFLAGSR